MLELTEYEEPLPKRISAVTGGVHEDDDRGIMRLAFAVDAEPLHLYTVSKEVVAELIGLLARTMART